jgi:hypothetical protein
MEVAMDRAAWNQVVRVTAIVLELSAVLAIAGQVLYVVSYPGGSTRDRLELVSAIANPGIGLLVLGAALLALASVRSPDVAAEQAGGRGWVFTAVVVLGAVLILAAIFSIVDMLTVHIPSPGATGQDIQIRLSAAHQWSERVALILQRAAGGVLAAWGAWLAADRTDLRTRLSRKRAA